MYCCNTIMSTIKNHMANNLPTEKKVLAVSMLAEGSSIRAIERVTEIHRDTIMRLGVRVGQACAKIQDEKMRNIQSTDIQIDEIWGFIGKKKKHAKAFEANAGELSKPGYPNDSTNHHWWCFGFLDPPLPPYAPEQVESL